MRCWWSLPSFTGERARLRCATPSSRSTCGRANPSTELRAVLRPPARLLAQAESQARRGGQVHAPALQLEALVEERLQPVEVLEPRLARIGRGEVQVDLHREVGREL